MTHSPEFLNSRQRKAHKIKAILHDHLGQNFKARRCLDIGSREGTILASLNKHFEYSFGVDVDFQVLRTAQSKSLSLANGQRLPFPSESFHVILCAQVYEHVQDVAALIAEIHRTLKPGGVVFFSGPNRLALVEEHYQLPLLSWLPKKLAHRYLRTVRGIQTYEIKPLTERQLHRQMKDFEIIDYTLALLQDPLHFALEDRLKRGLPGWAARIIKPLVPNFNWILTKPPDDDPIPSNAYTQDYFLNHCDGQREFHNSQGAQIPHRLAYPLEIADIQPSHKVLDVGCGRGEIVRQSRQMGAQAWGVDFAPAALKITKGQGHVFLQAEAQHLPFQDDYFDTVFMLDVVEHLNPAQLQVSLAEVWRVLRPGGQLFIHTMPNLWYYHYGYPLYRAFQRLRGQPLPRNPRQRWAYAHLHVSEQTPHSLNKALAAAGFETKVWLENVQPFERESSPIARRAMAVLASKTPFKLIFCNDIFARATK